MRKWRGCRCTPHTRSRPDAAAARWAHLMRRRPSHMAIGLVLNPFFMQTQPFSILERPFAFCLRNPPAACNLEPGHPALFICGSAAMADAQDTASQPPTPDTTLAAQRDRAAGAVMGVLIGDALGVGPHW